jgi:hypothetical protein
MIELLEYVKNRIGATGSLTGEDIALRLASCGAVIRPQLAKGGFPARPLGSPGNRACRPCTLPVRLDGAFRIALVGNPRLSVTGQHRAVGTALIPLAGDSGLTLAGQPRALCAPGEA